MRYVEVSFPREDGEILLNLAKRGRNATIAEGRGDPLVDRAIRRLEMALRGRDLRSGNRQNTPRAKGDKATADEMLRRARRKWA